MGAAISHVLAFLEPRGTNLSTVESQEDGRTTRITITSEDRLHKYFRTKYESLKIRIVNW